MSIDPKKFSDQNNKSKINDPLLFNLTERDESYFKMVDAFSEYFCDKYDQRKKRNEKL